MPIKREKVTKDRAARGHALASMLKGQSVKASKPSASGSNQAVTSVNHLVKTRAPKTRARGTSYRPEFDVLAGQLALTGFTNERLAEFFGVSSNTIVQWQNRYPTFRKAVKAGKAEADGKVASSLFARANGSVVPDTHIHVSKEGRVTKVPTLKHYPPDPTSMIFWLKNRQPDYWKDRVEHTGQGGGPIDMKLSFVRPGGERIEKELNTLPSTSKDQV